MTRWRFLLVMAIATCPMLLWGQAATEYGLAGASSGLSTSKAGSSVGNSLNKAFNRVERALSGQKSTTVSPNRPAAVKKSATSAVRQHQKPETVATAANHTGAADVPNVQQAGGISVAGAESASTAGSKAKYKRNLEIKFDQ